MLKGFYTCASGMLVQQRSMDVISNNLSNAKTPGFRVGRVMTETFDQTLMMCQEGGNNRRIGSEAPIRYVETVSSDFDASLIEDTGRPFDMALNGQGYFNIQSADDEETQFLSRNGNFDIDEEGYLILRGVGRVMGEGGPIQVGTSDFTVDTDGSIYDAEEKLVDKLLVTMPAEDAQLVKESNGLYSIPEGDPNEAVETPNVLQSKLERSNIDLNREFTMLMEANRYFQACGTAIKIIDTINQKAATQIASLS